MITRLQQRFIIICTSVILVVFTLIFLIAYITNKTSVNRTLDALTDIISESDGSFPDNPNKIPPKEQFPNIAMPGFFNKEIPFTTRFFTVRFDNDLNIVNVNIKSISSVTEQDAINYAKEAIKRKNERGWEGNFRYKKYEKNNEYSIIFVDGFMQKGMTNSLVYKLGFILTTTALIVILLIVMISKKVMKPILKSYEKQKEFITNVNHELKTPLTLIMTNLDILESDIGKNVWIDGIRLKGNQMNTLVGQLVTLSRLDEGNSCSTISNISLTEIVLDSISEFSPLIDNKNLKISTNIEPNVEGKFNEESIRRLVCILLDNAVKYCDVSGDITVMLKQKRHITLIIENTYQDIDKLDLNRLFDRFYRSDKARTFGKGFGIGLSIAEAIVEQNFGNIVVFKSNDNKIAFKVTLKK